MRIQTNNHLISRKDFSSFSKICMRNPEKRLNSIVWEKI